jgi:hypothetical protein
MTTPSPTVARSVFRLTQADGSIAACDVPGRLGGNRRLKIYAKRRVFFADEATAIAAGYRPCAVCMPAEYRRWKSTAPSER